MTIFGNSFDNVCSSVIVTLYAVVVALIIIITMTIFIVLSSTAPAMCESLLWFIWAKVGQRQMAANSQAKLQTLTFESACRLL